MHESFVSHRRYRYLKLSLLFLAASLIAYIWHDPVPTANGGTWLGYTLGGFSALMILWLLYLGIRKRRFGRGSGTLKAWVSAHIWFGLLLLVLATLHTGFQFGWNIHTLAYALMVLVILTGIYGLVLYMRNPQLMTLNREQQSREIMYGTLQDLDHEALQTADQVDPDLHHQVAEALQAARPAGTWTRLRNRYWSATCIADRTADRSANLYRIEQTVAVQLAEITDPAQVESLRHLLETLSRRRGVSQQLGRDISLQALMEFWLYLHVPLSIALLAALLSHILAVFFYW